MRFNKVIFHNYNMGKNEYYFIEESITGVECYGYRVQLENCGEMVGEYIEIDMDRLYKYVELLVKDNIYIIDKDKYMRLLDDSGNIFAITVNGNSSIYINNDGKFNEIEGGDIEISVVELMIKGLLE